DSGAPRASGDAAQSGGSVDFRVRLEGLHARGILARSAHPGAGRGMIISLVVAMAENRVIGRAGGLPWHLPDDLKHFKRLTVDQTVIMGRRTFDEIKRPLANRRNVVVSRNQDLAAHGVTVVPNLEEALALGATEAEVFVIGGGKIFALALPLADRLYLTLVH